MRRTTARRFPGRLPPILAGIAGLAWFWAELAPQRTGFADTDDPSVGLRFVAAHPEAWPLTGVALAITAVALIATVLEVRGRLVRATSEDTVVSRDAAPPPSGVAIDTLTVLGLLAAAMLLGMGVLRLAGGPMLYVRSLDESWGEVAYLVIQFAGVQLLLPGGFALLAVWIGGTAWIGRRAGVVSSVVAVLAVVPVFRLAGILGPFGIALEGLWPLTIAAIPAAFVWLLLFGLSEPGERRAAEPRLVNSSAGL